MTDDPGEILRRHRDEFHMAMGYCIAAWAEVDDALFLIFLDCLGPYDQSAVIYYRTPGLDIRLGLINEIVRVTLLPSWERPGKRDPRIREWDRICKEFHDLLAVRRRIAHHPVEIRYSVSNFLQPLGLEIDVGRHEKLRDKAAKLVPLDIKDLLFHRIAVEALIPDPDNKNLYIPVPLQGPVGLHGKAR